MAKRVQIRPKFPNLAMKWPTWQQWRDRERERERREFGVAGHQQVLSTSTVAALSGR